MESGDNLCATWRLGVAAPCAPATHHLANNQTPGGIFADNATILSVALNRLGLQTAQRFLRQLLLGPGLGGGNTGQKDSGEE